jgi:transposase-like protein
MLDTIQTIKSCPRCGSEKLDPNGWRGLSIRLKCASCGLLFVEDNCGHGSIKHKNTVNNAARHKVNVNAIQAA